MSSFTEPLVIMPSDGCYETARSFSFDIGLKGSGLRITIPAGFKTDLASIPRWLWWLYAPHDPQYAAAAVVHDFLCNWSGFDLVTAHAIFLDGMLILGVPRIRAVPMFLACLIFNSARR